MATNHIIGAMQFIADGQFDKAICLWRMYMRFRHYCTNHCMVLGLEPSTKLCGKCLSDNLLYTAEHLKEDLAGPNETYVRCSGELDGWLDRPRPPAA